MARKKVIDWSDAGGRALSQDEINRLAQHEMNGRLLTEAAEKASAAVATVAAADVKQNVVDAKQKALVDVEDDDEEQPADATPKRKRGRPKKSNDLGGNELKSEVDLKRTRGRPKKSAEERGPVEGSKEGPLTEDHPLSEEQIQTRAMPSKEVNTVQLDSESGGKRRRGRPKKSAESGPLEDSKDSSLVADGGLSEEQIATLPMQSKEVLTVQLESELSGKRKRGRPRKSAEESRPLEGSKDSSAIVDPPPSEEEGPKHSDNLDLAKQESESSPKRKRGRPKKSSEESPKASPLSAQPVEEVRKGPVGQLPVEEQKGGGPEQSSKTENTLEKSEGDPRRKRGRPKKSAASPRPLKETKESSLPVEQLLEDDQEAKRLGCSKRLDYTNLESEESPMRNSGTSKNAAVEGKPRESAIEISLPLEAPQEAKETPLPAELVLDLKAKTSGPSDDLDMPQELEAGPKRKRGRPKKSAPEGPPREGARPRRHNTDEAKKLRTLGNASKVVKGSQRYSKSEKGLKRPQSASAGAGDKYVDESQEVDDGKVAHRGKKRGRPRKGGSDQAPASGQASSSAGLSSFKKRSGRSASKASVPRAAKFVQRVEIDGVEFLTGQDVYVRKSDASGQESDTEVEDCRICGTVSEDTMLECGSCLAGYHLGCLSPPLKEVPEDDWICSFCEKGESPPEVRLSRGRHRSARERLLGSDLWAARIERMWRDGDGTYWFRARWFVVPEETALGRQPHNGRRELFRSDRTDDNQMDTILRHCYVMSPEDYKAADAEGDDVFFCEYEYNEKWCKFKRIEYLDDDQENWSEADLDELYSSDESADGSADDEESPRRRRRRVSGGKRPQAIKGIRAAVRFLL